VGNGQAQKIAVTLLTGGADQPYAYGLAKALMSMGVTLDLVGNDDLDCPQFHDNFRVRFLNLRGDQSSDTSLPRKILRVIRYYARLLSYALTAEPKIFHILWNNKFEFFDRTLLMFYYRLLGKRIVLTVHNVNAGRRDSRDTPMNRLTLRVQYRLSAHIFVHTSKMKDEIVEGYGVPEARVTVIPFGINNAVPRTHLDRCEARKRLSLDDHEKVILFFGNIAPYKGLEFLIAAFQKHLAERHAYRLIIAGRPKGNDGYWSGICEAIWADVRKGRVLLRGEYVPDGETEIYFKAADVLVLPYRYIYESGVLYLGYSFGLPVLAANVGSLRDEVVEGKTGFVFQPEDPTSLAKSIERYFASDLYENLEKNRPAIVSYAVERHSWSTVSRMTLNVYTSVLRAPLPIVSAEAEAQGLSVESGNSQELHVQSRASR
jgi:D-inositol-3-phosphate glycosyltransferase